ncbi:hypothetical protein K7T73_12645 [Bacillus badius]|uniref:hypothetical protein n=1 Tax=Bacillus badius TaxID=1455 RepID=UPI001CBC120A|nr:hypothetical protein [Bacillus badius]UAT29448.1 hypothetical protein K7T73_12645 [Bacillus badius]
MNELTREQYQRQWESLNAAVNPKPSAEQRTKMLDGYQRERQARIRTQRMLKELNAGLMKEIMAGK